MRSSSLRRTVLYVSFGGLTLVVVSVMVAAGAMFISTHDAVLISIVTAMAAASAAVAASMASTDIARDLEKLRSVAAATTPDRISLRADVERNDELGTVARTLDDLLDRLETADEDRRKADRARRSLLAAIGHDLRTPLAALQAALEALQDGVAADPNRYLRSMEHDVAALSALVDDLFLLSRLESGTVAIARDPIDLAEIADEAVEALNPVAVKNTVSLELVTDGRVETHGGAEALSRVIRNLLDNAIRHAPSGSTVRVAVSNGTGATVQVTDDGPGFPDAFVGAAFEAFSRSDASRSRDGGGAGLGLAIAQRLVALHDGRIWVESGPGGRVGFTIPI